MLLSLYVDYVSLPKYGLVVSVKVSPEPAADTLELQSHFYESGASMIGHDNRTTDVRALEIHYAIFWTRAKMDDLHSVLQDHSLLITLKNVRVLWWAGISLLRGTS